jgi:ABC-type multidrug transport system fused ATPase/permease subunit
MGPRGAYRLFSAETRKGHFFDWSVITGMFQFVKPYRRRMLFGLALMLVVTGLTLLAPYLIKVAIDQYIARGDIPGLVRLAGLTASVYLVLYAATAGQQYILSWVAQRVLADLRQALFKHLQALSLSYHDTHIIGVTVSRLINDVAVINDLLTQGLISLIGDVLVLGGIIIVMLTMSPRLALLTFTVMPMMLLVTYLFSRQAGTAFRKTRASVAALVGKLAENINAVRVIQAFAQERLVIEQFETVNRTNRETNIEAIQLSFKFLPTIEFLGTLATAIVLWFGGQAVSAETVTIGVMVAFLAYVTRFFQPIQELSRLYTTMQSAMAGGEQVLRLLGTEPDVLDKPGAQDLPQAVGKVDLCAVNFQYRDSTPRVLHDVDLHIQAGTTIALVGPTGAGKTTIARLIARLYEVSTGCVCIDDIDVRSVTQTSLRRQTGIVPQDPFLFSGTIEQNIRFGLPHAPDEKVIEAARLSNAHQFIVDLPDGYQTQILEGAANLSVGQRQLICIARAALAEPRILILDEATSSVDTMTEAMIQEALQRLLSGRTAIVIAHRLSTIRNADLICVVDRGRIVQQGTHQELHNQQGLYRTLYEEQFNLDGERTG